MQDYIKYALLVFKFF